MDLWNDRWHTVCLGDTHTQSRQAQVASALCLYTGLSSFPLLTAFICHGDKLLRQHGPIHRAWRGVTDDWWCVLLHWWQIWLLVGMKPTVIQKTVHFVGLHWDRVENSAEVVPLGINRFLHFLLISPQAVFEEPEDPSNRSFFSEIISSISDVKFSHSGRYLMTRDYLTVKVWDLNMESKPLETYQVQLSFCFPPHMVLRSISA